MEQTNELDKLKKEILSDSSAKKDSKAKFQWGSIAVTGTLLVLALVSVSQAAQSINILSKIDDATLKVGSSPASSSSGTTPLPSNLQNLPNMVGGC